MPLEPTPSSTASLVCTVALAGNPNSGKTTLFNALTKLRQKVGNYSGVTVEKKTGTLVLGPERQVNVIDLPGTYSLSVRSPDEAIARDVLLGRTADVPKPDLVVCVVDAGNLERNLYLVTQIQDLRLPVILALNMMDEAERQGRVIQVQKLSELLGVPIVPMVAFQQKGIEQLKQCIAQGKGGIGRRGWRLPGPFEEQLQAMVQQSGSVWQALADLIERHGLGARTAAIEARYQWIKSVVKECQQDIKKRGPDVTERIDAVLTHKIFGWLFFLGIMGLMFYMIFTAAVVPMDWIDQMFGRLRDWVLAAMPEGDLRDLLANGVIAGVGGVVVFLPQILILFFFISLLQDTGYMARAAFIMDRVMSKVGLHGKSFIPLLSSFACAIPGIMAARTIENPKDRLVTVLVAPLMSCSARLPVYAVMIAVIMPQATAWQKAALMLSMYVTGIVGACGMAWFFKSTLLRSQKPVFIMELPPYRWPAWNAVVIHMWERGRLFLTRAGTVIMAMSIVLWALMTFPRHPELDAAQALKASYAGRAGTLLEPVIQPLGYDWRIGIGLIGSFAAREVFVSTMNIVFDLGQDAQENTLREAFQKAQWPDGRPLFTPLVCLSLMVFYVFALQCASTIAVVYRETNSWTWPLFQFCYMAVLAYLAALAVYQLGRWAGFS